MNDISHAKALGVGDYFWNAPISDNEKIDLIKMAINQGVNYIDTAEEYGAGKSEKILSRAVCNDFRHKVIIGTKFSPQNARYSDLIDSCQRSLDNLSSDHIDLYQMHWPNPDVNFQETCDALSFLLEKKLIKRVGLCNCNLDMIYTLEHTINRKIDAIQMEFNLTEQTIMRNGIYDYCLKNNIPLLSYSPLEQGNLSSFNSGQNELLSSIAKSYNLTIHQVILSWINHHSNVVPIFRTSSHIHLRQNIDALSFNLADDDYNKMDILFPRKNYIMLNVSDIEVAEDGEWDHPVYQTLEEAIENKHGFIPSPKSLAVQIHNGEFIKPVRVNLANHSSSKRYKLVGGRVRYWAWVIAFGNTSLIPAYIK